MLHITNLEMNLLDGLERYLYLSGSQACRACNCKNNAYTVRILSKLANAHRPLVFGKDYGPNVRFGRLEKIFALTEAGAQVVADYRNCPIESLRYLSKAGIQYTNDYHHRFMTIDFHIALEKWAGLSGANIDFFCGYYETVGSNRGEGLKSVKKNKITLLAKSGDKGEVYFVPDGIFAFQHNGKSRLCALEVHRRRDTKQILNQLQNHVTAIERGLIKSKLGYDTDNFVLSVFENENAMQAVLRRLGEVVGFEAMQLGFHFTTEEKLSKDMASAWIISDGRSISLFS